MKITKHAAKRVQQRGLDIVVLRIIEELVSSKYNNQSQQIFFKRKDAMELGSFIRKIAERVEKHAGVQLVLDARDSELITAYRRRS